MFDLPERIQRKIMPEPMSGCWIWIGARNPDGYGNVSIKGVTKSAHIISFIASGKTIPNDMELDHLCRNRACVNPDHLEAVTKLVNQQRGIKHTRTHCPHGHEFTAENIYQTKRQKHCRQCGNEKMKLYRKRKKNA